VLFGGGVVALGVGGTAAWRAQAALRRRARALSRLALDEGERLAELAERLNRHGFEFQHTMDDLAPKLAMLSHLVNQPLVAAAMPWVLRRVLGRSLKRRG
jgi:hypothetical protein